MGTDDHHRDSLAYSLHKRYTPNAFHFVKESQSPVCHKCIHMSLVNQSLPQPGGPPTFMLYPFEPLLRSLH